MWRECGERLTFTWWIFGGSWRGTWVSSEHLRLSRVGEVDLERSLDGGWLCLVPVAARAVKELCGLVKSVHIHGLIGALFRRPGPVPLSADDQLKF